METDTAPEDAAIFGNREHDMVGDVNNGLFGVGVLYGYGTQSALQTAGAQRLASVPDLIPKTILGR